MYIFEYHIIMMECSMPIVVVLVLAEQRWLDKVYINSNRNIFFYEVSY